MSEIEDKPVVEPPVVTPPVVDTPPVEDEAAKEAEKVEAGEWDDAVTDVLGEGIKISKPEVKPEEGEKTEEEKAAEAKAAEEAAAAAPATEPPAPSTAEIVRETLREADKSRTEMEGLRKSYQQEIIDTLYPEGVDRQLVDAEGKPINGVSDLKKLINPNTSEYFTGDEAAEYLLAATQKLNKELADFDSKIDNIVDTQITLQDGVAYINKEYGQLLKALPEEATKIRDAYFKNQLVIDPKTNTILSAKMPIEEFYDVALAGYKKMAAQLELKAQGEKDAAAKVEADAAAAKKVADDAAVEAKKAAKIAQSEREGISQSGTPIQLSKEDAEWDEAMDEVLGKKR